MVSLLVSDFKNWKSLCLVVLLLHYLLWVATLVICSSDNNSNLTLPIPLAVYAWSIGQSFTTLGLFRPLSEMLTKKAWDSFEKQRNGNNDHDHDHTNNHTNNHTAILSLLPPTDIPTLNVQDYLLSNDNDNDNDNNNHNNHKSAIEFLERTYGRDWIERPLLLKGLWTREELSSPDRRFTPQGLLNMDPALTTIPYFTDARIVGALVPDATAPVRDIIRRMIHDQKPHKIGSQFIVQNDPTLLEEVVPPHGFLTSLFGNHFSQQQFIGGGSGGGRGGRGSILGVTIPGTTTVPVFIANSNGVVVVDKNDNKNNNNNNNNNNKKTQHIDDDDDHSSSGSSDNIPQSQGECLNDDNSNSNDEADSCQNPSSTTTATIDESVNTDVNADIDIDTDTTTATSKVAFTGLHCEPIANVAVQLWGSRTWTLVDPRHSWKLKPSISNDGRSFYPSWISTQELETRIPRYVVTTQPGDAVWLPTWTYHKVEYTYTYTNTNTNTDDDDDDTDTDTVNDNNLNDSNGDGEQSSQSQQQSQSLQQQQQQQLSIGASLFHFRPYDYLRRNLLFAILLIPSLIKEFAGSKTQ